MKCPRCQHENPPQAKFCLECAAPLALRCANCGTQLPAGAKFCFECATPVSATGSPPRFTSPEAYTPKHLAERILTSKAALEGERKQVTVLFADLKGSMELLADRDPEEARKLLDPVLELMMEAVHRYEGTVNQVMGDGIMALFGAPLAHEDHAVRACYAALRMQEIGQALRGGRPARARRRRSDPRRPELRRGRRPLHRQRSRTWTTRRSARRPTSPRGWSSSRRRARSCIDAGDARARRGLRRGQAARPRAGQGAGGARRGLRGDGGGPGAHPAAGGRRRGLTRFVGRDAELEQLRRAQQLAGGGHGQVVAIVGEAGVGKSRLVYEFTHSHRLQGWLVLESASVSYGKATSYLPVIDLLKGYFKIHDRDDLREIREKVTGKLLTLDRVSGADAARRCWPCSTCRWTTPHGRRSTPVQRRQRTLDAVKRLLLRESARAAAPSDLRGPALDRQRDPGPARQPRRQPAGSARLLLLVNYRPEYQHGWGSKTYYSQLRLDPLPAESAGELLEALAW